MIATAYHLVLWGDDGPLDLVTLAPAVTYVVLAGGVYGAIRAAIDFVRLANRVFGRLGRSG